MDKNEATEQIRNLLNELSVLKDMHEYIRIVDPLYKSVFTLQDDVIEEVEQNCHDVWARGSVCNNCVSMRAYNDNESLVKIDYSPDKVYMVTAVPVPLWDRRVVVEMIKDVTKSMFIEGVGIEGTAEIRTLIDNLSKAAYRDALTNLFNKRFIGERLPVDVIECRAARQPLSLILCDIDHFKKLNDTYGHETGDYVLKTIASILTNEIVNDKAWVARYGGEEFMICLPYTDRETAIVNAEAIRKSVQKEISYGGNSLTLTMSFGVGTLNPSENKQFKQLIEHTDKLLYDAKRSGRNKVVAPVDTEAANKYMISKEELGNNENQISFLEVLRMAIIAEEDLRNIYLEASNRVFHSVETEFLYNLAEQQQKHLDTFIAMYESKKDLPEFKGLAFDAPISRRLKALIQQHSIFADRNMDFKKTGTIFGYLSMMRKAGQWKIDFYEFVRLHAKYYEMKELFEDILSEERRHNSELHNKIETFQYRLVNS